MRRADAWNALEREIFSLQGAPTFRREAYDVLEEPVRRWLFAAIANGTPLTAAARLRMRGSLKLGRWLPFTADQLLAPQLGTVWSARVAAVISGHDRYVCGQGGMAWKLGGLVPVMRAAGTDVTRSSAGRVAGESVWVPTAVVGAALSTAHALEDDVIRLTVRVGEESFPITHRLDGAGRVVASWFSRWGDPDRSGSWGSHQFGLEASAWETFDGITIPTEGVVGWHYGTDRWEEGQFFRFAIRRYEPIGRIAVTDVAPTAVALIP